VEKESKMVIDWKNSKAHLLLLSRFINANRFEDFTKHDYWKNSWNNVLGEPSTQVIKRFVDEGILMTVSDLNDQLSYKYRVTELKDMLKQRGLSVSGHKEEMIKRLALTDPNGIKKAVAELSLLKCTQLGYEIVVEYLMIENEKRINIEHQVMEYLREHDFRKASLTVAAFESEQVFPRGIGIDWNHYNPNHDIEILKTIFENKPPKIIVRLGKEKLEAIRIAGAMMALWGENKAEKWLPENFETNMPFDYDTVVRMMNFYAQHKAELEADRKSGVVKGFKIVSSGDSCESCKKLNGKCFSFNDVPELPYEHCTHKMGCRCSFRAILK
jgi:hypothetical protein